LCSSLSVSHKKNYVVTAAFFFFYILLKLKEIKIFIHNVYSTAVYCQIIIKYVIFYI